MSETACRREEAGIPPLWAGRANILEMTREAERAVISPREPGRWPRDWRSAVAARVASLNHLDDLARSYLAPVEDPAIRALATPGADGRDEAETLALRFVDLVAGRPREVRAQDIEALKKAGIGEADIVRLCELNAFLAYRCQVAHGVALMEAGR